jgi:glycosyltransferase involved in cell wall biosynthesis
MCVSILVMTLNEEINIGACLDSVAWCHDIVVLDSFSTDRTVEIARERGARVMQRVFDDYAGQRNFGLQQIVYRNDWLLMLDADERVPPDLHEEIVRELSRTSPSVAMFRMRRKDHLFGRWIRGSSGYPTWFGRLARIGRVRVERPINEEYHADGDVSVLNCHLHHYPFNKGFAAWLAKHDRYSSMEAELRAGSVQAAPPFLDLFRGEVRDRRRALKAFAYRLPGRPLLVFIGLYILKGGVFEGRAGLTFSLLRAVYEFMIDCKYVELKRRAQGRPV